MPTVLRRPPERSGRGGVDGVVALTEHRRLDRDHLADRRLGRVGPRLDHRLDLDHRDPADRCPGDLGRGCRGADGCGSAGEVPAEAVAEGALI